MPHINSLARSGSPSLRASQVSTGIVSATNAVTVRIPDHASNANRFRPTPAAITITMIDSNPASGAKPSPVGPSRGIKVAPGR